jgi:hypothetical protein
VTSQTCEIGVVRQLVDRCATGEGQAWRDLHRAYYPTACRFPAHMGEMRCGDGQRALKFSPRTMEL